jgi:hypothetical protein
MNKKVPLKQWEILLLLLSLLLFITFSTLYATGISLKYWFISGSGSSEYRVGMLKGNSSGVRRQLSGEGSFDYIEQNDVLYNHDTIVADPDGHATLILDDGSEIELGEGSMIRLAFESNLMMSGISRLTRVNVLAGKVSARASTQAGQLGTNVVDRVVLTSGKDSVELVQGKAIVMTSAEPIAKAVPPAVVVTERAKPKRVLQPKEEKSGILAPPLLGVLGAPLFLANRGSQTTGGGPSNGLQSPAGSTSGATTADTAPVTPPVVAPTPTPTPLPSPKPSQAPKQDPIPEAVVVSGTPAKGTVFSVPNGSKLPQVTIKFTWTVADKKIAQKMQLVLKLADSSGSEKVMVAQPIKATNGSGAWNYVAKAPGQYSWEIRAADGRALSKPYSSNFKVNPEYLGIRVVQPLVAGKVLKDNQVKDEPLDIFDLKLGWEPYSTATEYEVKYGTAVTKSTQNSLVVFKNQVQMGITNYQIFTKLPSGFKVGSQPQKFKFAFLPPILVSPKDGGTAKMKSETADFRKDGLLLTWVRTHFTQKYVVQVAANKKFSERLVEQTSSENFTLITGLKPGRYYWHVRSVGGGVTSSFGRTNMVNVTD